MRVWVLLVALGGCNWLYGLDETRLREPDLDGDGVTEDDNCPTIANDQTDTDDDQVGDLCDPCVMGVQKYIDEDLDGVDDGCDVCPRGPGTHDDDTDGLVDACDNCPGVKNATQANADSDDLGDDCDPHPTTQQTRLDFSGFEGPLDGWLANTGAWMTADDAVGPTLPASMDGVTEGLWNRSAGASSGAWVLEATVNIPAAPATSMEVGIATRTPSGNTGSTCYLQWSGSDWRLFTGAAASQDVMPPLTARLRLVRVGAANVRCELVGVMQMTTGINPGVQTPVLFTVKDRAAFTYADFAE